jgi:hypothetical protein
MMMIGALDIKVPKTGTNQNTNTIRARVIIYGNPHPAHKIPMSVSHIVVRTVFTSAIIPCARNISQNPFQNFSAIIAHSS